MDLPGIRSTRNWKLNIRNSRPQSMGRQLLIKPQTCELNFIQQFNCLGIQRCSLVEYLPHCPRRRCRISFQPGLGKIYWQSCRCGWSVRWREHFRHDWRLWFKRHWPWSCFPCMGSMGSKKSWETEHSESISDVYFEAKTNTIFQTKHLILKSAVSSCLSWITYKIGFMVMLASFAIFS